MAISAKSKCTPRIGLLYSDAVAFGTRQFGGGAGPIYLDNVACSGSESTLLDCPRSSFVSCHSSRRGAGVRCQGIELMIILT